MIRQYKGFFGEFQYDDTEFIERGGILHYIGTETDGSKIKIPKGIRNCDYMFSSCSSLINAPTIPEGVTNCGGMFYDCESLIEAPAIPEGVTDCHSMFSGCNSLRNYSLDNTTFSDDMYCSCPPIIQEIDSFIQNFKERNLWND